MASLILIVIDSIVIMSSFSGSPSQNPASQMPQAVPVSLKSPQWSGYVVMSNLILREAAVTTVSGAWTVPSIETAANDTYSSIWVGVGGYGENSLIQTGTAQQGVDGVASYYVWYEMLPNRAVRVQNFSVSPGDEITAAVRLVDSNQNRWSIEIRDLTNGKSYSRTVAYNSSRFSAEWVVEAPSISGRVQTLSNFGSVTFTNCFATISETTGAISDFPGNQLIMYDRQDVQLVDVSSLNSEGSSFTVTYRQ